MARSRSKTLSSPPVLNLAAGARVEVRDEEWIVRHSRTLTTGGSAIEVVGVSELVRDKESIFTTALDTVTELHPAKTQLIHDSSPKYAQSKLFLETLLRKSPPSDDRIYCGHRGAMQAANYQLLPAAKALKSVRPRILIADGVGLGKTIEVGILLSELIRRGRGRRILVVALKSVLEQFQEELWARFTIPLVRLDSAGIARVQRKIPANMNPFHYFNRVIISIDTLKKDEKYRRFLEQCRWDAVVIDECQHVADRSHTNHGRSRRSQLATLLARQSDALIMTSATPHDGRPESFASLMNLLEPTAVANTSDYSKDEIDGLYVRRFKKDIANEVRESFSPRILKPHNIDASPSENALFDAIDQASFQTIGSRGKGQGQSLFRVLLLKSALSSPNALASTLRERLKKPALREGTPAGELPEAQHDRELIAELIELCEKVKPKQNQKLQALIKRLKDIGISKKGKRRVVVFSERVATLDFLKSTLQKELGLGKSQIDIFYGSVDDKRQQELVKEFGSENGKIKVLLASDAAAEGINLHYFCHHLVHYDIPWSLITLEQRNGRIDRYGQKEQPEIDYLLTVPAADSLRGDLRVLDRLIEKEEEAHKNLGDVQWLMGLATPQAEEDKITRDVADKVAPEDIIPDFQPEEDALFSLFGGDDEDEEDETENTLVEPAGLSSLYQDDYLLFRDALTELKRSSAQKLDFTLEPHIQGVKLEMTPDLERRFNYLPPELRRQGDSTLRLCADRNEVQNALAESRSDASRWPEWHLLWDQHPVCEWIFDRLMACMPRHSAPVLCVAQSPKHKFKAGDSLFVGQGVMSNQRGQPMIVKWMAVHCRKGKVLSTSDFGPWIQALGLDKELSNPRQKLEIGGLEDMRQAVVDALKEHMQSARSERAAELKPLLKEQLKKIKRWAQVKEGELNEKLAQKQKEGPVRQRLLSELERVKNTRAERSDWIKQSLATSDEPYLRIAAVIVAKA